MGITENELEKSIIRPIKKRKKIVTGIIISICTLLVIYFGMAIYFMNHFYFGSEINGISVSGEIVENVNKQMASEIQKYKLNIKERGGKSEQINGKDVGLKYNSDGQFKDFKDRQNPYKWVSAVFNKKDSKMVEGIKYDKNLLKERVDKLSCFDSSNVIEPKNASFKYTDNGYMIVGEVLGNKVNKDILYEHVSAAVSKGEATIDLESINYYVNPQYTSKSKKVVDTRSMLNKYVSSKITYTFGEDKELLDSSTINKWIVVDENIKVTFDEKEVENYMDELSNKYNTIGKSRNFVSSSKKAMNINTGDYGWSINKDKETEALISTIKEGKTITKEPAYTQTALYHGNDDMGNTYVEIDLTTQHLWFYKNGSLIVQGDVVTGTEGSVNATPPGIYKLKYKEKNATLKGQGYAAPVNFWMPFNGGIGIHDASWRDKFGGVLYKSAGSHGCINSPYDLAKTVFDNIESGTPVVCYN
ncbi:L,D-transpeptidase/peptidoglycan binding protein [Clostridium tagluense]|uniref:L,D-transpeptidase family protein n=1 Tax=Clostridium tagluense TaxID=360422 RepID=UPI001CF3F98B|nr:peptidoglycan binding domain-containing protein [Clostridium tagluense]MCB2311431.1 L,D-transpeptidase/peptidoglycan binding protein [Clostridium tagluense]MCB2316155.1 L,D-transpeptidase/peptidoglycan binding protein [Clostridium tagluense]MCB2321041.1 L,D-transpeptidase/peptidoglycan binding protein [Clostridium tagluense]MCB2326058.1 L,D-transpeptidase/peptidoglycan binding protein [Clostridium tagluense]MCB2330781.1 L,D-transpeptidase/peptidoglycan binding protein [Clostridium tagluense